MKRLSLVVVVVVNLVSISAYPESGPTGLPLSPSIRIDSQNEESVTEPRTSSPTSLREHNAAPLEKDTFTLLIAHDFARRYRREIAILREQLVGAGWSIEALRQPRTEEELPTFLKRLAFPLDPPVPGSSPVRRGVMVLGTTPVVATIQNATRARERPGVQLLHFLNDLRTETAFTQSLYLARLESVARSRRARASPSPACFSLLGACKPDTQRAFKGVNARGVFVYRQAPDDSTSSLHLLSVQRSNAPRGAHTTALTSERSYERGSLGRLSFLVLSPSISQSERSRVRTPVPTPDISREDAVRGIPRPGNTGSPDAPSFDQISSRPNGSEENTTSTHFLPRNEVRRSVPPDRPELIGTQEGAHARDPDPDPFKLRTTPPGVVWNIPAHTRVTLGSDRRHIPHG